MREEIPWFRYELAKAVARKIGIPERDMELQSVRELDELIGKRDEKTHALMADYFDKFTKCCEAYDKNDSGILQALGLQRDSARLALVDHTSKISKHSN